MDNSILNIALADDDEDDRMLFEEVLEGIEVRAKLSFFTNGQELMDYLSLPNVPLPNLLFMDLNMPIKNGLQCLREIRKNPMFNDIFIAIYSTSSREKDIQKAFVDGADIYINKANTLGEMRRAIEKVLRTDRRYHTSHLEKSNFLLRV